VKGSALLQVLMAEGRVAVDTYRRYVRPHLVPLETADAVAVDQLLDQVRPD
jgi:hypothetical protein